MGSPAGGPGRESPSPPLTPSGLRKLEEEDPLGGTWLEGEDEWMRLDRASISSEAVNDWLERALATALAAGLSDPFGSSGLSGASGSAVAGGLGGGDRGSYGSRSGVDQGPAIHEDTDSASDSDEVGLR